jgi:hypothetical protein
MQSIRLDNAHKRRANGKQSLHPISLDKSKLYYGKIYLTLKLKN